jgi:FkbM family methyltransferase
MYRLDGMDMRLLLSHELPLYRKFYPQYSSNLGRIVKHVAAAVPDFSLVDVGANVGDSVAIVRNQCHCPMLCIEGVERYFSLLYANTVGLPDIELEQCFVGAETSLANATLDVRSGTARVIRGGGTLVTFRRLSEILAAHPRFAKPGMIKIDADGMDCEILKNEAAFLARTGPIVFFEYDPHFFQVDEDEALSVFASLAEAGYDRLLVYDNLGDYMLSTRVGERAVLLDLLQYFSGRGGLRYCDICAFPRRFEQLWSELRSSEVSFFRAFRGGKIAV